MRPDKSSAGQNKTARSAVTDCPNKLWVELEHKTEYPDDYGQVEPAAHTTYRVTFGNGSRVDGKLDQNGFARFDGIPDGEVQVDYEPDIDKKVAELKQQLRQHLDEIIAAERAEYQHIEAELQKAELLGSNKLARASRYTGAFLNGLWNGAVGIVEFAWDVIKGGGKVLYELGLRLNPITAPQKFKEDLQTLKKTYDDLKRFADEDLEAYVILMGESDIYAMFKKFGSDLVDAQHPLEMTEAGGELALDIALAIITGGAGAASNVRHAGKLKKLKAIVDDLVDAIKRKRRRKRVEIDTPNRKIVTRVQLRNVPCFCPFKGKGFSKLSPEARKKYLQEYDRQLQRQQDAINNMSVDEYLAARKAYKDNGRNPLAQKLQTAERDTFEAKLRDNIMESLKNNNKSLGYRELKKQSEAQARDIMKKLDALHEPDMVSGGWSNPKPERMGDAGVNSSIGGSWGKKDRLSTIDDQASQAAAAKQGHAKMNVKLEVCRGRRHCP